MELKSKGEDDEHQEKMQGALNVAIDILSRRNESLQAVLVALREEVLASKGETLAYKVALCKVELNVCKVTVPDGGVTQVVAAHKVEAPKSKACVGGTAREIDNILWNMERYFNVVGISDDITKVRSVSLLS